MKELRVCGPVTWKQTHQKHFLNSCLFFTLYVTDFFPFRVVAHRFIISPTSGLHEQHDWAQGGVSKHPHDGEFSLHHTHTSRRLPQSWSLCGSWVVGCVVVGKNGWGFMVCSGGHFIEEACGLSDFRPSKQALIHDVCNKFEGNKRNSFKDYCSLFNFWYVFHSRTNKSSVVTTVM